MPQGSSTRTREPTSASHPPNPTAGNTLGQGHLGMGQLQARRGCMLLNAAVTTWIEPCSSYRRDGSECLPSSDGAQAKACPAAWTTLATLAWGDPLLRGEPAMPLSVHTQGRSVCFHSLLCCFSVGHYRSALGVPLNTYILLLPCTAIAILLCDPLCTEVRVGIVYWDFPCVYFSGLTCTWYLLFSYQISSVVPKAISYSGLNNLFTG